MLKCESHCTGGYAKLSLPCHLWRAAILWSLNEREQKRPCVTSRRESWLGWAAWRMNVFFRGESPGLTNDYKSQGEKILGRVSLATWKGSRTIWENSLLALWDGKRRQITSSLGTAWHASCIVHINRSGVLSGPRNGVPRDMRTPISHCPHFFPSPKFWLKVEFGVTW